jgi:hypothetical protein
MFALAERGGGVDWVTPPELRDRMERSPEMGIALDRLQVQSFLSGRVERIGDPLFGEMYRLGALEGSDIALIPVEIRERLVPDQPGNTRVETVATLIQLRTGRVIWFGVVGGTAGPQGGMAPTASAMEALAREILP